MRSWMHWKFTCRNFKRRTKSPPQFCQKRKNMEGKNNRFRQEGNQLIYTRLLDAPRELVWEVWTKPEHLSAWWGPNGFTLTHKSMQVRKGSEWKFTMHG